MRIFLVGFMGSGKTHWGKLWSSQHNLSFIDLDDLIEEQQGKTIRSIFEEKGEEYFRKIESEVLHSLKNKENIIVASGGGTPCFHNNIKWMNENGTTVYLKATPAQLAQRLIKEKQKRPVIMNTSDDKLEEFIAGKLKDRESFYEQAELILEEAKATVQTFAEKILPIKS